MNGGSLMNRTNRTLLATAVCMSLAWGTNAMAADTAAATSAADQATPTTTTDTETPAEKKKAKDLETVTVTGSLIPRSEKETSSPIIKISAQDLQAEGFRSVYDALKTVTVSSGSVQDSQAASVGSFTPGATTISLFQNCA